MLLARAPTWEHGASRAPWADGAPTWEHGAPTWEHGAPTWEHGATWEHGSTVLLLLGGAPCS